MYAGKVFLFIIFFSLLLLSVDANIHLMMRFVYIVSGCNFISIEEWMAPTNAWQMLCEL